jgi:hypothetical protein
MDFLLNIGGFFATFGFKFLKPDIVLQCGSLEHAQNKCTRQAQRYTVFE